MLSLPVTKQVYAFHISQIRMAIYTFFPIWRTCFVMFVVTFVAGSHGCELTGQEDPIVLYMVIENLPLQHAFKEGITQTTHTKDNLIHWMSYHTLIFCICVCVFDSVMKFKQKSCFLEFAVHLLQKALLEDELDLVLRWEQNILNWLSRWVCLFGSMFAVCVCVLSYISLLSVILLDVTRLCSC